MRDGRGEGGGGEMPEALLIQYYQMVSSTQLAELNGLNGLNGQKIGHN